MVVLLRKNALFYRTQHGADVGDLFTSLIHTCDLNKINSLDYLTAVSYTHLTLPTILRV